jgi:hypothetical protein
LDKFELPDVDLDVKDRDHAVLLFERAITASQLDQHGNLTRHKSGMYFQDIPIDPVTGYACFPYDVAEPFGYYKVDFLPYHIYDGVKSERHLNQLLARAQGDEFPWQWFQEDRFYTNEDPNLQVTQITRQKHLCEQYPPRSVDDLAILNALIRPRKKYLVGHSWEVIKEKVWHKLPGEEGYFFKKSHAVAFALAILVHMQLIDEALRG